MNQLQAFEQRAHRHGYEDGIAEILLGVLLAAGALLESRGPSFLFLIVAVVLALLLPRLRERYTSPRIGFATVRVPGARLVGGIAVFAVLAGLVTVVLMAATGDLMKPGARYRWLPGFAGFAMSGGFIYAARVSGLRRFHVYTAATVAGSLALALTTPTPGRVEGYERLSMLLGGLAVLLIATGALVFARFLRQHPMPPPDAREDDRHAG